MNIRLKILLCCVFFSSVMAAQTKHSAYMSVDGNMSFVLDNSGLSNPRAGGGGGLGIGYELKHKRFILDVGAEGEYARLRNQVEDFSRDYTAVDTEGDKFTWRHRFYDRTDEAEQANVGLRLMLGGRFDYVYFLVGPKLMLNMWGRNREQSKVDASGKYEGLIGEFEEMDNHSLYKGRQIAEPWSKYSTNVNLRLAGEVGIPLNAFITNESGKDKLTGKGMELRLGVYVEAGVLNLRKSELAGGLVDYQNVDTWPGVDFKQTYVFSASETENAYVTDMQVGLRLTMLLVGKEKKKCVICTDNYL